MALRRHGGLGGPPPRFQAVNWRNLSPVTMDRVSDRIAAVAVGIHDVRTLSHVEFAIIAVKATHNDRSVLLSIRRNVNRGGWTFAEAVCVGLYEITMQQNGVALGGNEMELGYD